MKLCELYSSCIKYFTDAGIENPESEARFLIDGLLGISYTDILLNPEKEIAVSVCDEFLLSVKKRVNGEPLQYIIGSWDFMDYNFQVGPGVLIPRPETEILCQRVIEFAQKLNKPVIYDLCSGSGCIGLTIKKSLPSAEVYLVEKSKDALKYLRRNAETLCGDSMPAIIPGDVLDYDSFFEYPEADIIVSNPPYIASAEITTLQKEVTFEPEMALDGGEDGLVFYRYIIGVWKNKLKNHGVFFFEIGDEQGKAVSCLLDKNGFDSFVDIDYNNHDRIVIGRMK